MSDEDGMTPGGEPHVIRIPRRIADEAILEAWQATWDNASSIRMELPEKLSEDEIRHLHGVFAKHRPKVVAFEGLFALAEHPDTPADILRSIYENGDTACQVAVCTRPDIPRPLVERCLGSTNADVLEHVVFSELVSIEDCQVLMASERGRRVWSYIERAVAIKRCR